MGNPFEDMANTAKKAAHKAAGIIPQPPPVDPAMSRFADYLKAQREGDMQSGVDFASKYFGEGNPAMKEILDTRKKRALGLNQDEIALYRDRGNEGINNTMQTGLRQLRSFQGANHIRGGAAGAQAMQVLAKANQDRAGLERDISLADMERRGQELSNYEHSLTGEREGTLGTAFGFAGLGAGDRSNAMQYTLGNKFLDYAKQALGNAHDPNFGPEGAGGLLPNNPLTGRPVIQTADGGQNHSVNHKGKAWYDPSGWDIRMSKGGGGGGGGSIFDPSKWG